MRTRGDWLALALALAAFAVGVVFALTPPNFDRSEIVWEPTSPTSSGSLILARGVPEQFEVRTTCDKVRAADPGQTLVTAGTLVLTTSDGDLALAADPSSPSAEVALPQGACEVTGRYDLATATVSLEAGTNSDARRTAPPRVKGLLAPGSTPAIDRVVILTQPTGTGTSWLRWGLGLGTFALACVSLLLLIRTTTRTMVLPRRRQNRRRPSLPRIEPLDAAVLGSLVVLALVVPALLDDGWILVRSELIFDRGWFGNVYTTNDAWLPQGFLHESLIGALQRLGLEFVHLRLVMAGLLTITWVILRSQVLAPVVGSARSHLVVAAATYIAFSGAWLMTVRAEPVVVLFGTLTLVALTAMDREPRPIVLAAGLVAGAMAIGAHQSGWVALGPVLMLTYAGCRAGVSDRARRPALVAAAAAAGALSLLLVFPSVDVRTALNGAREFAASGQYGDGLLSETSRYVEVFNGTYTGARAFTVLLVAALMLAAAVSVGTDPARRRLWVIALAWMAGLLLTSSKWPWHFGVYAVPATVFAALAASAWRQPRTSSGLGRGVVLPVLMLLTAMSFTLAGAWGVADLSTLAWVDLSDMLVKGPHRYGWYLAVAIVAALGVAADRGRLRRTSLIVLAGTIVTPLSVNMAWVARDALQPGWSFAGSSARQLTGDDSCGVLSGEEVVVRADPLPEVAVGTRPTDEEHRLVAEAFPRLPAMRGGPLYDGVSTWGSWFPDARTGSADGTTGLLQTPSYVLDGDGLVTVWTTAGAIKNISARAVYYDGSRVVGSTDLPLSAEPHWALHTLEPPAGATSVLLQVDDATSEFGGWAAVSTPSLAVSVPVTSAFHDANAYVTPFQSTQFGCVPLPDLDNGLWPHNNYTVRPDPYSADLYVDLPSYGGVTQTQVLCVAGRDCVTRLDYPEADVRVRALH